MPSAHRLVVFDLDGVLVDSKEAWLACVEAVVSAETGRRLPRSEFEAAWGQGIGEDVRQWFPHLSRDGLARRYGEEFPRHAGRCSAIPGMEALLRRLRSAGRPVACATNSPRAVAVAILEGTGLRTLLDDLACADDVGAEKPDPAALHLLAGRAAGPAAHGSSPGEAAAALSPDDVVLIGDTGADHGAARAFGCAFIGFRMENPPDGVRCCSEPDELGACLLPQGA